MATTSVLATVYETLLCSPGMNEMVKIDVRLNRKTVLLLNSIIDSSLEKDGTTFKELLKLVPEQDLLELKTIGTDTLNKAGLADLYEKIKTLV